MDDKGCSCAGATVKTVAQHCMEGFGEEKPNFPLLKSVKRQKSPLGRIKCLN